MIYLSLGLFLGCLLGWGTCCFCFTARKNNNIIMISHDSHNLARRVHPHQFKQRYSLKIRNSYDLK